MNERTSPQMRPVLVVDNDPLVRLGTVVMLREMGYSPVSARDGSSAMALMAEGACSDLVVTDYSMPGMTGVELARQVMRMNPHAKILIVSGHDRIEDAANEGWPLLNKPFTSSELGSALRILLGGVQAI